MRTAEDTEGLYFLKFIAMFFIVIFHIRVFGGTVFLKSIARFSVLAFFMISGYFTDLTVSPSELSAICRRRILKSGKLLAEGFLLYFAFEVLVRLWRTEGVLPFLRSEFSIFNIGKFLLTNVVPCGSHLWYLSALIYVYVLIMILCRTGRLSFLLRYQKTIVVVLFGINMICGGTRIFAVDFPECLVRNWLFTGVPAVLLGNWMRDLKVSQRNAVALILLGTAESVLSYSCLGACNCFLGSIGIAIGTFSMALNFKAAELTGFKSGLFREICKMGKEDAGNVYVIHLLVATILPQTYVYAVTVCAASLLISRMINRIQAMCRA